MPDFFTGPTCESENLEVVREIIPSPGADKKCHARLARFHPKIGNFFAGNHSGSLCVSLARGGHRPNPPARATASHPRRRCNAVEMPRDVKVDPVAAEASFKRYMEPVRSLAPRPLARIPAPWVDRALRRAQMTRATSLARGDE